MKSFLSAVIITAALLTHAASHGDEPDAQYIAELLMSAHLAKRPFPDILKINPSLSDAFLYDVQKRYIDLALERGAAIGGYKGGFIPKASIGGVLFASGMLRGSPVVDRRDFTDLLVEAEIGFRLCGPRTSAFSSVAELKRATCAVFPAIELPDAAVADLAALRADFAHLRRLLIPIDIAASHVLMGEPRTPAGLELDRLDVRVNMNDKEIGFRDGTQSTDDIWSRVLWVINEYVLANGYSITDEHIIIPGALTGLHPGLPGRYSVSYGALGTVDFEVR